MRNGLLTLLVLAVAGALLVPPGWAQAPSAIKIGATLAVTGAFSPEWGPTFLQFMREWEKIVNEDGGVFVGDVGRKLPIQLIIYDDESNFDKSVELYEKLGAVDKVDVFLGPSTSPITLRASTVAERMHIPMVAAEANDTSAAVGYAPLTPTERLVLDVERYLNAPEYKRRFPETGEDVKVMAFRQGRHVHLTLAMPLLCAFVESEAAYFRRKGEILEDLTAAFAEPRGLDRVTIGLNLLDREGRGLHGTYLSLLGTSAEDADSGQVGRGNRVNGLIPLNRPMSNEAAAGKNPVSHVGKIYNVLAHRVAATLHRELPEIREVTVWLVSQIGAPVDQPWAAVQVRLRERFELGEVAPAIRALMEQALDPANPFFEELIAGRHPIC